MVKTILYSADHSFMMNPYAYTSEKVYYNQIKSTVSKKNADERSLYRYEYEKRLQQHQPSHEVLTYL